MTPSGLSLGSILVPKKFLLLHGGDSNGGAGTGGGAVETRAGNGGVRARTVPGGLPKSDRWPADYCCIGPNAVVLRSRLS